MPKKITLKWRNSRRNTPNSTMNWVALVARANPLENPTPNHWSPQLRKTSANCDHPHKRRSHKKSHPSSDKSLTTTKRSTPSSRHSNKNYWPWNNPTNMTQWVWRRNWRRKCTFTSFQCGSCSGSFIRLSMRGSLPSVRKYWRPIREEGYFHFWRYKSSTACSSYRGAGLPPRNSVSKDSRKSRAANSYQNNCPTHRPHPSPTSNASSSSSPWTAVRWSPQNSCKRPRYSTSSSRSRTPSCIARNLLWERVPWMMSCQWQYLFYWWLIWAKGPRLWIYWGK